MLEFYNNYGGIFREDQSSEDFVNFSGDLMYWKCDTITTTTTKRSTPSAEIEMTSYALLAMLTRDKYSPVNDVMPIIRWLTKQRNAYGGFTSTQVRHAYHSCSNKCPFSNRPPSGFLGDKGDQMPPK